ncbi:MAG: hypothetical protein QG556_675 [Pseudomonadota bacterium]|nr:hypothetical protein [Pseudomonadota bacterium]
MGRFTIEEYLNSPFEVSLQELFALQKWVSGQKYPTRHSRQNAMVQKSKVRGRGMDYAETKNYFPGDEVRLMDWRVTARTQKPHVKVFEVERECPVMVVLNMAPSMFFGTRTCLKSVLAAQLSALLAWTAKKQGDRVGGMLSSSENRFLCLPHARNQTLIHFLKTVSLATTQYQNSLWSDWSQQPQQDSSFRKALQELNKTLKPGTLLLLVNDWYDEPSDIQPYLYELRRHHDMILYHVCDPLEQGIELHGIYPIAQGKEIKNLNLQNKTQMESYREFALDNMTRWQNIARKIGVPYHPCSVDTDLTLLVRQSLLRR